MCIIMMNDSTLNHLLHQKFPADIELQVKDQVSRYLIKPEVHLFESQSELRLANFVLSK